MALIYRKYQNKGTRSKSFGKWFGKWFGRKSHSHNCEGFAEREGLLIVAILYLVCAAGLEGRAADEGGTSAEGEGDADAVNGVTVGVKNIDGFAFYDVEVGEQDGGVAPITSISSFSS